MTDQIQPVLQGAESGRVLLDATVAVLLLLDHPAGLFQTVTGPLAELPGWLQAAGWGAMSASGLRIGAVGGYYTPLQHTMTHDAASYRNGPVPRHYAAFWTMPSESLINCRRPLDKGLVQVYWRRHSA
jgi:hypothetical protein